MMINLDDNELHYYQINRKCVVCGKPVEFEPKYCITSCITCEIASTCEKQGKPINIPLCHPTEDTTDLDCPKLIYGWMLLENRNKLEEFLEKFTELDGMTYPTHKYQILQTIAKLEKSRVIDALEAVFGVTIWLYMN